MPERDAKSNAPPSPPTPPARPPVSEVLRESFLGYFVRPDYDAAIRLLADLAGNLVSEGRAHLDVEGRSIWPYVVRGTAGDLRQAADQLASVSRDLPEAASDGREVARVMVAIADASAAVAPLADALDAAAAAYLAGVTK